jgi:hypothetical protein
MGCVARTPSVLETQTRTLFGEALLPPENYRLDRVVGTTYTLDLAAMLIVPLAMTFSERNPAAKPDPLALLEALRRNASRITVYCKEDRIAVPRTHQPLFAYLEPSVIPVRPPSRVPSTQRFGRCASWQTDGP